MPVSRPDSSKDEELRPRTPLVVETRRSEGADLERRSIEVTKPAGPVRQHEQLVGAVVDEYPDARLHRASDGKAVFLCHDYIVTAYYAESAEADEQRVAPSQEQSR